MPHKRPWLWALILLVVALAIEPRTQHSAHAPVHIVRASLDPACIPLATADGVRLYFYALTAHFGRWVSVGRRLRREADPSWLYGQLHKRYRRRRLVRIRYRMQCRPRRGLRTTPRQLGGSGKLRTRSVH